MWNTRCVHRAQRRQSCHIPGPCAPGGHAPRRSSAAPGPAAIARHVRRTKPSPWRAPEEQRLSHMPRQHVQDAPCQASGADGAHRSGSRALVRLSPTRLSRDVARLFGGLNSGPQARGHRAGQHHPHSRALPQTARPGVGWGSQRTRPLAGQGHCPEAGRRRWRPASRAWGPEAGPETGNHPTRNRPARCRIRMSGSPTGLRSRPGTIAGPENYLTLLPCLQVILGA